MTTTGQQQKRAPNQQPQPQRQAAAAAVRALQGPVTEAQKAAARAKVARTALALRNLAIAAEAMRRLPGGGAAADGLLAILDRAVNKGGKFFIKNGKLERTLPPPQVGWAFLVSVAPWAMRGVGAAVTAARVGIGRFGPALIGNLKTGAAFVASKVGPLLAKAKENPAFQRVAGLAGKALTAASVLLGLQGAARLVMPGAAAEVEQAAAAAVRKARRGAAQSADKAAEVAKKAADAAAAAPAALTDGLKWAAAAAAALVIIPKLL